MWREVGKGFSLCRLASADELGAVLAELDAPGALAGASFISHSIAAPRSAGHLVLFTLYKTAKVHVFSRPKSEQMTGTYRPTIAVATAALAAGRSRDRTTDSSSAVVVAVAAWPAGRGRSIDRHFIGAAAIEFMSFE